MAKFANQLLSKGDAIKAIHSAARSIDTMQARLQLVAVTAIGYANIHQDIDVAREAFETFKGSKGIKAARFLDYIQTFGCVAYDAKKGTTSYADNANAETADVVKLLETLHATKWYEFKVEQEVEALDVEALLQAVVKRVLAAQKSKREVKHAELLDGVVDLLVPKTITNVVDAEKVAGMTAVDRIAA